MRFGPRRNFLKSLGMLAGTVPFLPSLAEAVEKKTAKAELGKSFYKNYMNHFHGWYNKTHFNFDKAFSGKEKAFVNSCINGLTEWSYDLNEKVSLSSLTYSHRVKGEKVNSSRIGYGSFQKNDPAQKLARDLYKARGIASTQIFDEGQPIGLGWDFNEDLFKVYFYEENLSNQRDQTLMEFWGKAKGIELYSFGLRSYSFKGGKLAERRLYVPVKPGSGLGDVAKQAGVTTFKNEYKHLNLMITDQRGVVPQLDMENGVKPEAFNTQGQTLIAQYEKEFKLKVDTLAYNSKDEFTLYYP